MDVLVPIDDSEPAQAAIEHALTTYPDANIVVLHVIDPAMGMYSEGGSYNFERIIELEEEKADALFENARELAAEHDASITTESVVGTPRRDIVEFAEENDIDHLVIGSHGRAGVSRVLLGSVAEHVTRRASIPVTVVR